jgi:nucleoside-diphosphate-sugar epimerase
VFVSSIGVNGSHTTGRPFVEADPPAPEDFYSVTKWEAEQVLQDCAAGFGLVVVRPTLVAGAGAPGNLEQLVRLIRGGLPVPVLGPDNRRNLIGVRSLAELLSLTCVHPAAVGRLFLAADDPPLSVAEMATEIASGLQRKVRLLRLPRAPVRAAATLFGRSRAFARVGESLLVDARAARSTLGWRCDYSVRAELRELGNCARLSSSALK